MSSIILTSDLTITEDVTLIGSDGSPVAGYEVAFGASVSLINFATVTIVGNDGELVAGEDVIGLYEPFGTSPTSVFWNKPGAVFDVSGNDIDAFGLWAGGGGSASDVINEGTIRVTSNLAARGIEHFDPTFTFANTGLLQVSGQSSGVGVFMHGGGSFDNAGTVEVTGGDLGSVGVNLFLVASNTSFINSGTITATATGSFPSIGVAVSNATGTTVTLHNSGTIAGDYAIWENQVLVTPQAGRQIIENSGTLIGAVELGLGDDIFHNEGAVFGYVGLGEGNDLYDGASGVVTGPVFGDGGVDTVIGGAGDEVFIGGVGADTAVYDGNRADYSLDGTSRAFTIADGVAGRDGTDTVFNVEFITFADGTFAVADLLPPPPPGAPHDFDGDGTSDILVTNGFGALVAWTVENGVLSGPPSYVGTTTGGWNFLSTGDFNGDAATDILVTNGSGALVAWTLDNGALSGPPSYIGTATGGWSFLSTGDFNGDAITDILVSNGSGALVAWTVENGTLSGPPTYIGTATNGWSFLDTGDFNGDGTTDILVTNDGGALVAWSVENGTLSGSPTYIGTATAGWSFLDTGDFNGDGTADILVTNDGGALVAWSVENGTLSGAPSYIGTVTGGWDFLTMGDYNGDGTTDILVGNGSDDLVAWTIENGTLAGTPTYIGTAANEWEFLV